MHKPAKLIRQLVALLICLIFLASCGDSPKEAKVDKSNSDKKTETPKAVSPPKDDPDSDKETSIASETSEGDMKDNSEAIPEKEAEPVKEDSSDSEAMTDTAKGPEAEEKSEPEVAVSPDPEPAPEPKPVEVAKAEPKAEEIEEPEPVAISEPKPEPVNEPTPVPVVEPTPEPEPVPTTAPEAKPEVKVAKTSGQCPQPRKTKSAPSNIAKLDKTSSANADNGKKLYTKTAKPMACKMCHGDLGDGAGKLGAVLKPPPRNFTCDDTMKSVTAGQMFWIIKNGSKGTGMVAHKALKDADIWDVVKFIRADFVN